ncbi:titin-like protein [Lates japonicus]|uniref:Titin-like protein n=1 Tax=Lates japonicus TaxID=270547 RepID=A0AAD3N9S6_LATJO|nr:titin-like protein [Lates japonicus]
MLWSSGATKSYIRATRYHAVDKPQEAHISSTHSKQVLSSVVDTVVVAEVQLVSSAVSQSAAIKAEARHPSKSATIPESVTRIHESRRVSRKTVRSGDATAVEAPTTTVPVGPRFLLNNVCGHFCP